jgi:hypothetical protein
MIYTDDNRNVQMIDITQEQNDILKKELGLSQFNTLHIISVKHAIVWGSDIKRSFKLAVNISKNQKDVFLKHIEESDNFDFNKEISNAEIGITYHVIGGSKVEEFVRKEGTYNSFTGLYLIGLFGIIILNSLVFIPYKRIFSHLNPL